MKFRNPIMAAMLCVATMVGFTSCDDDNGGNDYPDNFAFKQVLRVEQFNDGTTNALANFIALDGKGQEVSVQLPKESSVFANNTQMRYAPKEDGEINYYAYGAVIPGTPKEVRFVFRRLANLDIVNTVNLEKVPMITPAMGGIENNKDYKFKLSVEGTDARLRIFLMAMSGENRGTQYDAVITGTDNYRFSNVPAGTYSLRAMSTIITDHLQEQNGTAGGQIEACKVYQINSVTVK